MLKIAEEYKCIDDISVNSNKEVIDFLKTLEEKLKKMEEKERKFQEEEKRERKIFFDANYKTIYKAVMYDIKVKESEYKDFEYDEKYIVNALDYMYRVSYYKEYLMINNSSNNE